MKLVKIKINQFRGIENAEIILNEMLNFIVYNNIGKTRVLECINQFYSISKENIDLDFTYQLKEEDKKIIKSFLKIAKI